MGSWYDISGRIVTHVKGKNGKQVRADIRHARLHRLFPRQSTICRPLWDEGNRHWFGENCILASQKLEKHKEEEHTDWINRCIEDASDQTNLAMQQGLEFHDAVKTFYATNEMPFNPTYEEAIKQIAERVKNPVCELSGVSTKLGFGYTIDAETDTSIIDYKTTTNVKKKVKSPDFRHGIQLVAYRAARGVDKRLVNCYIDRITGEVMWYEWNDDSPFSHVDLLRIFALLSETWFAVHKHDPRDRGE